MEYKIYYVADEKGKCQVLDFVETLGTRFKARFFAYIHQLSKEGPLLPRPIADTLREGIHELRFNYKHQERILCFFMHQRNIFISHAFNKRGSSVPQKEIKKAILNRQNIKNLIVKGKFKLN
ncbi:type II toxin-antitoxin system RelE/ParE family toxin [bacterium]|nr:type II toxin-antitoxin system RelE/ParE family toxin [bacterium]